MFPVCVCASFPFSFADGMWDLIVLVPDHCLFTFLSVPHVKTSAGQLLADCCVFHH